MKSTRRRFLQQASATAAAAITGPAVAAALDRKEVGTFLAIGPPPSEGRTYKARVPDSHDLVDYADYAINGLTQTLDPEFNYEIFFRVQLGTNPPYLEHDTTGLPTINPKFAESLAMMRVMTGSNRYADVDQKLMQMMIDNTGQDGLYYSRYSARRTWHEGVGHNYNKQFHIDFANVYGNSRLLLAMMAWYQVEHDSAWEPRMQNLAHALCKIAIPREDYSYYPDSQIGEAFSFAKGPGWLRSEEPMVEHTGAEGSMFMYHCGSIRALSRYHAMTGDNESIETATRLVRFVTKTRFWGVPSDKILGAGTSAERAQWEGHPHGHTAMLMALLEYSYVVNDPRLARFVRNAYQYQLSHYGLPRIGMFGEGCTDGDMVALSIMLSDAGQGDYWDDTDSFIRNHLIESMFTDEERIRNLDLVSPVANISTPQDSAEDVLRRSIGVIGSPGLTHMVPFSIGCCTGNVTQAIYYAWASSVRHRNRLSTVNLLVNRASPWLDVDSFLPYQGKVILRNKTSEQISVRIPAWVDRAQLRCNVNEKSLMPAAVGNFVVFEGLKPNDTINLEFPVKEETEYYTYRDGGFASLNETNEDAGIVYTLRFRGNTLVDVSPREDEGYYPIYRRDQYKQSQASEREVTRYVAPQLIKWWSGDTNDQV
jgi:Beta-L-arabinofuranosidase, GH127